MSIRASFAGLLLALAVPAVAAEPVDINEANAEELMTLDGVGEVIAQRIIEYRRTNDGFASKAELQEVDGIGAKTVEGLRSRIEAGG